MFAINMRRSKAMGDSTNNTNVLGDHDNSGVMPMENGFDI